MSEKKTLTVKLVKSVAGTRSRTVTRCAASGCARSTAQRELEDTPAVRGMINKVSYLVKVL
jgi:large subunit ribosomal protein L30